MTADHFMQKAQTAVASARLLLDADDVDGASNRAYYAMFDAARAALMTSGTHPDAAAVRTHSGLISAFSLHLVKPGTVDVELGRSLNKAYELRLIADYRGDAVDRDLAAWAVARATVFVQAIADRFFSTRP